MKKEWKSLSWAYCSDCECRIDIGDFAFWDETIFGKKPEYAPPYFCKNCAKSHNIAG